MGKNVSLNGREAIGAISTVTGNFEYLNSTNGVLNVAGGGGGGGGGTQYVEGVSTAPGTGTIALGRYLSTPPTLTNGQLYGLQFDVNGNLKIAGSFSVGGIAQGSSTSGQTGNLTLGATTTAAPSYTTGTTNSISLTTAGALRVDSSATTQPVSLATNTPTLQSGSTTAVTQSTAANLNATVVGTGTFATQSTLSAETTKVIGVVRTADGTGNLLTSTSNALDVNIKSGASSGAVAQGSATAGQSGGLTQGAVTTAAPTYTSGNTNPLSLTVSGALRTDSSAITQPISGTVTINAPSLVSTVNSTTANLASNGVFTGTSETVTQYASATVTVFTDQVSATDGLSIQQSSDGTNWDITDVYTIPITTAGNAKTFGVQITGRFFRIVYTNGVTATTNFRLQVIYHYIASNSSSVRPQDGRTNDNDMQESLSYGMVYNNTTWDRQRGDATAGAWVQVKAALPTGSNTIGAINNITGSVNPGTTATALGKAEDAASASGDTGVFTMGIRRGSGALSTSPTSAVGDYQEFAQDDFGAIRSAYLAKTTNPTAATDGNSVVPLTDKLGKQVVVNSLRDLKGLQTTTLTSTTTETTIVTAGSAGVFNDIYRLVINNSSATATTVTIKDATAGTTRYVFTVPPGQPVGFSGSEPAIQSTAANNWTATCSTSVASVTITAEYIKNT